MAASKNTEFPNAMIQKFQFVKFLGYSIIMFAI